MMKKYLWLMIALLFMISVTHASTLKGVIYDASNGKVLEKVKITLNGKSLSKPSSDNGFKSRDFEIKEQSIEFILDGYFVTRGEISIETVKGKEYLVYNDEHITDYSFAEVQKTSDGNYNDSAVYRLGSGNNKILLTKKPVPVITGMVHGKNTKGEQGYLKEVTVSGTVTDKNNVSLSIIPAKINSDGSFTIEGDSDAEKEYTLVFSSAGFNDVEEKITVPKDEQKTLEKTIFLEERSTAGTLQDDLTSLTGFGCSKLMPKYLVGASCVENRKLQGDATDIALWIQKLGGMITSLISMIAVTLIVWNAFNIVTAAGDSEKVAQGKKGILWTILGLVVTMFAYLIVKTVIVLTYTQ